MRKVGIVGAGISGLTAAKHLARFNPIVFEATDSVGGVWRHCSFRSTKLQTPRKDYEFSDFPWEDQSDSFPTHLEILNYLESYATHFDLWRHILLRSRVVELKLLTADHEPCVKVWAAGEQQHKPPIWEVSVLSGHDSTIQVLGSSKPISLFSCDYESLTLS